MTPLSTFMYCFSGFYTNCTHVMQQGTDYVVTGPSCFAVLTATNWNNISTIYTPLCNQLSYFAITSALSAVTQIQINTYSNQPFLTGGQARTTSAVVCAYGAGQTVPIVSVYAGNVVYIGMDFDWSPGNHYEPGFMNLNLNGDTLQSLNLLNCYLTGINMSADFNCAQLNSIGFQNTQFYQGQLAADNGLKNFLQRLVSQGPNNGSLYALNDLNPLDASIITLIDTLTATKGWFYQRQTV